jgi:Protein of unknown function (DUF3300)
MITKNIRNVLEITLVLSLAAFGYQNLPAPPALPGAPDTGGATDTKPPTPKDLNSLVAPIALYPDQLVAQILGAATFPDQIAVASYWLQQNSKLTGKDLADAVNKQDWDASVKALCNFPSVLDNMAKNLSWTSSLGEAYHNDPAAVMKSVQTLRAQAKAAGNLKSGSQIKVVQESPDTIVIQPANPQVVYVPAYNPAVIYGVPYVVPGYTAGDVAAAGVIGFGAGIAVGAMMADGGWGAWGCGWHTNTVVYNHSTFVGNTAWHGGYYGGGYHGYGGYGYHGDYNSNFNRNVNANVNHNVNNFNRSNFDSTHSDASNWTHNDSNFGKSDAFSGHAASSGWSSRAASSQGWGSMHASGFSGGRFGGGGFGGGGFHGGFRR